MLRGTSLRSIRFCKFRGVTLDERGIRPLRAKTLLFHLFL